MRKLTKIINKRRKNYKPVTGVVDTDGRKALINTEHIKAHEAAVRREKAYRAEMEVRHEIHQIIRQLIPSLGVLEDAIAEMNGGFNPYFF